ncbi:MAG: S-layer homology domain-containing protein [Leptolyngbyaceae cyanobacterium SL_1_1]|nr:S-layer homology domain-containing protein [Leptolyngbyaceae cyanobacterium RM1_1_2]NJO10387.1 S-layer homology domain-containing protein [Leptolyngbyaceae cyanobacterium SL_1_1]
MVFGPVTGLRAGSIASAAENNAAAPGQAEPLSSSANANSTANPTAAVSRLSSLATQLPTSQSLSNLTAASLTSIPLPALSALNQNVATSPASSPANSLGRSDDTTLAQGVTLPDVRGHWAQAFIQPLVERQIIKGFLDGTFRPNEPVTRVQFAALVRQAFPGAGVRAPIQFSDISSDYWGYQAIQQATALGFLSGYPDGTFRPNQPISRVEVLLALGSGLNLNSPNNANAVLIQRYADAGAVPDYARSRVAAVTEEQIVVNYPDVGLLRPGQLATRAEVAAFIYQALVAAERAPVLTATNSAANYIVGYEPPGPSLAELEVIRNRLLLASTPAEVSILGVAPTGALGIPGSTIGSPTAFGADWGDVFFGATFQERARFTSRSDGAISLGFGLGDARDLVGLEVALAIVDLRGDAFEDGGFSFKLHRQFAGDWAIALGVENLITFGNPDGGESGYGVVSKIFRLREDPSRPFSSITASVGLGGGRFRSEGSGENDVDVFGSVGVRVAEPVSVIADWTGQDLNLGLSVVPFRNFPLVITPALADVTGEAGDGTRFIVGVGVGTTF